MQKRSVNNQYRTFPILKGDDLPYDFEIERSKKVYYRKDGALRRADAIYLKNSKCIVISINDLTITVKGLDYKNKWIYEVKKKENNNDKRNI